MKTQEEPRRTKDLPSDMYSLEPILIFNHSTDNVWEHPYIDDALQQLELGDLCDMYTGNLIRAHFSKEGKLLFTVISLVQSDEEFELLVDAYSWKFQENPDRARNKELFNNMMMVIHLKLEDDWWCPNGVDQFRFTEFGEELNRDNAVIETDWCNHTPDVGIHKVEGEWGWSS